MTIVKVTRREIADRLGKLWAVHEAAVVQRLEARDREVLDKLAKALNMPRHVRSALDWAYTRTMVGYASDETKARDAAYAAYAAAEAYVKVCLDATRTQSVYEYSESRRAIARFDGACAGYLFAAQERIGS